MPRLRILASCAAVAFVALIIVNGTNAAPRGQDQQSPPDAVSAASGQRPPNLGQHIFRFDTFGDQDFWGGTLQLHKAIEGTRFGGVGPGISPRTALALGLKVDVDALPQQLQEDLKHGKVNLDDPAVTLALLKLNAVVGITGYPNQRGGLNSVGIQCSLCHSAVDNSLAPGIGHRLDGWANRDLNVGAIVAASPNLQPIADLLGTDVATVLTVLNSWGPGKFDASLFMDGKAFRPDCLVVIAAARRCGRGDSQLVSMNQLPMLLKRVIRDSSLSFQSVEVAPGPAAAYRLRETDGDSTSSRVPRSVY